MILNEALHNPWKFYKNRARDTLVRDIYIQKFHKSLVIFKKLFWAHTIPAPTGVKFGAEEVDSECPILPPLVQHVTPAGKKT